MADLQKFLNQEGVSTLWTRIAEEVSKVDTKVAGHETRLATAESKIESLEKGTYDDKELRGLISANDAAIKENAADILTLETAVGVLNGSAETAGSVANTATTIAAAKVAEIVAGADADFDTLKEIADWIINDTTGAAEMANDIAALEAKMVGIDTTVVAKIAAEIDAALKVDGANKYALASDLTDLADRVKTLEDAGYQDADAVAAAIEAKITALDLANTYDAKGAAADALTAANSYTDAAIANIQALTTEDIDAAIAAASQGE